nr:MAG TPA: protein of unknown function (DUF4640) [Caudoviricetes sp.]
MSLYVGYTPCENFAKKINSRPRPPQIQTKPPLKMFRKGQKYIQK